MIVCSNCEFASAINECETCKGIDNCKEEKKFCKECSKLHIKEHDTIPLFKKIIQQNFLCSNCESNTAKFQCVDCPLFEQNFCLGCSIIHPKVKATRNHRVRQKDITDDANFLSSALPLLSIKQRMTIFYRNVLSVTPIAEFLEVLEYDFPLLECLPLHYVVIFTTVAGIAIFFLARRLVGKNGSSALIVISAVALLRFMQQRRKDTKSVKRY